VPTLSCQGEGYIVGVAMGETPADAAESENLSMPQHSNRENREIPSVSQLTFDWERSANVSDGKADMHAGGKSHESVVLTTTANNSAAEALAESDEGRDSAKRNVEQTALCRTPGRIKRRSRGLHGVREAARKDTNGFAFDSRQEPYEVVPHVRICAGGRP
jgi:hypothetical protein